MKCHAFQVWPEHMYKNNCWIVIEIKPHLGGIGEEGCAG